MSEGPQRLSFVRGEVLYGHLRRPGATPTGALSPPGNWEAQRSKALSRIGYTAARRPALPRTVRNVVNTLWRRQPVKAVRVTAGQDRKLTIAPLPLPAGKRKGEASAERYRQQAKGQLPRGNFFNPIPSDFLRAVVLSPGEFRGLATQPGALLSFVISGDLTLRAGPSQTQLGPGDILLTDDTSSPSVVLDVRNQGRLLQIGVAADWPGPEAEIQALEAINPSQKPAPNVKRVYTGKDDRAYMTEFPELFPSTGNQWSPPRRIAGFRMLCWEDGWMDFHPCVINQIGIICAGELEIQVAGGKGATEVFRAGDICLTEDRTGEGHLNRVRGAMFATNLVIETEDLWPHTPAD
jgi:hypothetical protein